MTYIRLTDPLRYEPHPEDPDPFAVPMSTLYERPDFHTPETWDAYLYHAYTTFGDVEGAARVEVPPISINLFYPNEENNILSFVKKVSRAEWLAALESGEYLQVTGALSNAFQEEPCPSKTCCIGVAPLMREIPFYVGNVGMETDHAAVLIENFNDADNLFAVELNDTHNLNFQQIAELFRLRWNMPRQEITDAP